jgi:hypothetical protein
MYSAEKIDSLKERKNMFQTRRCQIFLGTTYQTWNQIAIKYTIWVQNRQNGDKNTKIFHSKTLKKFPKLGSLV